MDKWLDKDMEVFSQMMADKGYINDFLVNNKFSGDLLSSLRHLAEYAYKEELPMFPIVLHTRVPDHKDLNSDPLLELKVIETDFGLYIREAAIVSMRINDKMKSNINVSFSTSDKFPDSQQLLDKIRNRAEKKNKSKRI